MHLEISETADIAFFQSWFRAKYANTIREGKTGSEDKDFEIIVCLLLSLVMLFTVIFGITLNEEVPTVCRMATSILFIPCTIGLAIIFGGELKNEIH